MLRAKIKAAEDELQAAEAVKAAANTGATKILSAPLSRDEIELRNAMVRKAIEDNAEVKQWQSLLVPKQMQLLQIETTAELGKKHPSYLQLQNEIAKAEQKLEELKQKLAAPIQKEVEFSLRGRRSDGAATEPSDAVLLDRRREELAQMRSQLQTYELAEKNVRTTYAEELKKYLTQDEQYSEVNLLHRFKKDELAQSQKVLERIMERRIALQTEPGAPPVVWHEPAKVPETPSELPYKAMALAGALALCLPYIAGLVALVLWNLGRLIRKLEPQ